MVDRINLPTRDVVARVSEGNQRQIKWFEDATTAVNDILANGGSGGAVWGGITGTLASQVDLQNALNLKANTSSLATVATSGLPADLIGFGEAVDDEVANLLVAGANITLTYNDVANTLTIASTGASGSGSFTLDDGTATTDGVFVMDDGGA